MTERPIKRRLRLRPIFNSLAVNAVILVVIFVACPTIVYFELRAASREKTELLIQSIQEQGRLIAVALSPSLRRFGGGQLPDLQKQLSEMVSGSTKVKVLFRPKAPATPAGFFYVASEPAVSAAYLDDEREHLVRTGIFNELENSCAGNRTLATRYSNPAGQWEILSSLVAVPTDAGCWFVLTSIGGDDAVGMAIGQPYWKNPEAKFAIVIYLIMAVLVLSLFFGIWRNLHGFARLAKAIGDNSRDRGISFRDLNQVPELTSVASEFDRMVDRVAASAEAIRDAAEETAHAFKTPIAAIAQSVEPLKRSVPQTDERGQRALQLIEKATERLDTLVNAARQMDEAIADLIRPPRDPVEFSRLLGRMLDAYDEAARLAMKRIRGDVAQDVVVAGSEDMFEIIVENLLDNALSFAPPGSEITVTLTREDDTANLEVADRGPGVESDNLERIFERYFSYHGTTSQPGGADPNAGHFGMGLWIARRNVESIGGTIQARNRARGGLRVIVLLPIHT